MQISKRISLVMLVAFLPILWACDREGCTDPEALNFDEDASIDDGSCLYSSPGLFVTFSHQVSGDDLLLYKKDYENAAGNEYRVYKLQYYVSDVKLKTSEGSSIEVADYHYIDVEDAGTTSILKTKIDEAEYDSIVFTFGLVDHLNKTNALPAENENINMAWPVGMGGGYHYMKLEGKYRDSTSSLRSFTTHIGRLVDSTGTTNPRFRVSLPLEDFIIDESNGHIWVVMDINEWFTGSTPYDLIYYRGGIMGNAQAQLHLQENGESVFSVKSTIE